MMGRRRRRMGMEGVVGRGRRDGPWGVVVERLCWEDVIRGCTKSQDLGL